MAISLAYQQGIVDENKLTDLVFHSRHLELRGRPIRADERQFTQEWLRIRTELVRPYLQSVSSQETYVRFNETLEEEMDITELLTGEWDDEGPEDFLTG
jgi:hypothetical protein